METYSYRRQKIERSQNNSEGSQGAWDKIIRKTAPDGFTHGNPRLHSPIKIATYTRGSWEDFIGRSDFLIDNKGIRIPKHRGDHFNLQNGMVALLEENELFNSRGIKRINTIPKESHVFDAFRKKYSTDIMTLQDKETWNTRFRSDYNKYYPSGYACPASSLSKQEFPSPNSQSFICQANTCNSQDQQDSYLAIAREKKLRSSQKKTILQRYVDQKQSQTLKAFSARNIISPRYHQPVEIQSPTKEKIAPPSPDQTCVTAIIASKKQDFGFERKKQQRKPLPTSEIQKQFLEYKKNFDFIQFG